MRYITVLVVLMAAACGSGSPAIADQPGKVEIMSKEGEKAIVLGGGCFWCLEAAYELVPGIIDVESGYSGGDRDSPSYEQVSTGLTGHAEVVKVRYDPAVIPLESILELFFKIHDPTTKDRQGADVGTQYRSIILYADDGQKRVSEAAIAAAQPRFPKPIVTQLEPLVKYWPAEEYHQDFYRKNPNYGYCQVVVAPKVEKAKSFVESFVPLKP